jgi:hypothetical protein
MLLMGCYPLMQERVVYAMIADVGNLIAVLVELLHCGFGL